MAGIIPAVGMGQAAASLVSSSIVAQSPVIAGRYQLRAHLGRGASGAMYRAHDRALDREVALRLLSPGLVDSSARERRALASLDHPHVVGLLDAGHADGQRFVAFELLEGTNLGAWQQASAPPRHAVLAAYRAAGQGLAVAHHAGIVHGNVKPSNCLHAGVPTENFLRTGSGRLRTGSGRVVVIDFGPPLGLGPHAPDTTYWAPEQLAGGPVDARSDQFSFCATVWAALFGRPPFAGADPRAHYQAIRAGFAADTLAELPAEATTLVRGLAFDPGARFPSLDALLQALEPACSAQSGAIGVTTRSSRLRLLGRRLAELRARVSRDQ